MAYYKVRLIGGGDVFKGFAYADPDCDRYYDEYGYFLGPDRTRFYIIIEKEDGYVGREIVTNELIYSMEGYIPLIPERVTQKTVGCNLGYESGTLEEFNEIRFDYRKDAMPPMKDGILEYFDTRYIEYTQYKAGLFSKSDVTYSIRKTISHPGLIKVENKEVIKYLKYFQSSDNLEALKVFLTECKKHSVKYEMMRIFQLYHTNMAEYLREMEEREEKEREREKKEKEMKDNEEIKRLRKNLGKF